MLLNRIENALMNNAARAFVQRHLEVRTLKSLGGPMQGGIALEVDVAAASGRSSSSSSSATTV